MTGQEDCRHEGGAGAGGREGGAGAGPGEGRWRARRLPPGVSGARGGPAAQSAEQGARPAAGEGSSAEADARLPWARSDRCSARTFLAARSSQAGGASPPSP